MEKVKENKSGKSQLQVLEELIKKAVREVIAEEKAQRLYEQQMYQPQYANWLPIQPQQPAYQPAPQPQVNPQIQAEYRARMQQQFEAVSGAGHNSTLNENAPRQNNSLPPELQANPFAQFITPKAPVL